MSAPVVSYEVWNNGMLAASRFEALATRALALCEQLSEVATLWQRARDQHGEEFPAWSYGDSELPASIRSFLADSDLAERVTKVQATHYYEYSREEAEERARGLSEWFPETEDWAEYLKAEGVSSDLAKRVARLLRSGERVSSDLAERVTKDLKAQGVSGDTPEYIAEVLKTGGERRLAQKLEATRMGDTLGATGSELESVVRDVSELEAVVRDFSERVGKAQREYAQQAALFNMRTSLQAASQAAVSSVEAEEEEAQREERERRRCSEEVSRLLETVAAEVSSEDRTAIEQRAKETVESPASRRRALLVQLHLDIQQANKAGRARQRVVQQVEQWRERLLGLEGTEVEQLDLELRQIVDEAGPLPPDMAQRVEGVVERATEASNRAYALGVITEELENLGYVVEVGFETASAQAPEMLLHKPDMEDEYHVSLRAEAGGLHNQVVREASDPSEQSAERQRTDEQMERTWCQDLATALAAAERRGVRGRAVSRNPPGEMPVQTIAPLKGKSKPKRKRKRTNQLRSGAIKTN